MKTKLKFLLPTFLFIFFAGCHSGQSSENETESVKLEKFLNIPLYPGAEMVMLVTDDRDSEIPRRTKPATVSLATDYRDSVPVFYEKQLGYPFLSDTTKGKTYYKLVFEKEGWEYEIMVGQDVFEDQPIFTISINKLPY
ncbi:MAG: hypothetical protein K9H16_07645 [Bacteroidales bacterium]|nr:hypothetical protein [Bacteroidales bacterium]